MRGARDTIEVVAAESIGGIHVGVTSKRLHRSNSVVRSRQVSSHLLSANGMYSTVAPQMTPLCIFLQRRYCFFRAYCRNSRLAI